MPATVPVPRPAPARVRLLGAAVTGLLLVLPGCSLGPGDSPPTGIDQLTVPSPSPDPTDFDAGGANAWFPLPAGADHVEVAGVATTPVERTIDGEEVTDLLATDEDGAVWWFGREGEWQVGDGVPLGLWLPADPRVGDGWARSAADGVSEERVTVLAVEPSSGERPGSVLLEVRSGTDPGLVRQERYVRGEGITG